MATTPRPISEECSICFDRLTDTTLVRTLPCLHDFCRACMNNLFNPQHNSASTADGLFSCPMCRASIEYLYLSRSQVSAPGQDHGEEQEGRLMLTRCHPVIMVNERPPTRISPAAMRWLEYRGLDDGSPPATLLRRLLYVPDIDNSIGIHEHPPGWHDPGAHQWMAARGLLPQQGHWRYQLSRLRYVPAQPEGEDAEDAEDVEDIEDIKDIEDIEGIEIYEAFEVVGTPDDGVGEDIDTNMDSDVDEDPRDDDPGDLDYAP
ncbi:hypothetical protein BJ875DRAFT_479179 [Amylocarpus encephaloides]|uniref:RING-type domain-containing protein n=1 Tax=Amylocarpus encephaloides TaxID=45428 RepID=A0A9P8CAQ0_9HELO|nr:hypothetical protein BJ875DRAFT_479179 [Amylocarpus encephaloides]